MNTSAQGQRVLVTAGASGIGSAFATTFAAAGAHVFICDVDAAALASFRAKHPDIGTVVADVADSEAVDVMFGAVAARLGGLDVLINNAGIAGPTAAVEDISVADWDRTIAVDLNGMFYCTRRAVPLLKAAGGGSIVNLSSIAGRLGYALRTPYSAAKWAVARDISSASRKPGLARDRRRIRLRASLRQAMGVDSRRSR